MTDPNDSTPHPDHDGRAAPWERTVIERLAGEGLKEQKRARRWNIFFKFAFLGYATVLLALYLPKLDLWPSSSPEQHTALVEIKGPIGADTDASADAVITALRRAFEDEHTAGVVLRINSPGGSPVQSGYINDEISRLRKKHPETPLYAVITDLCASGGYYIAAAADEIYADKASIIGSIGVLMNGFGFVDTMDKLGVERRLITAGEHKSLLDPFSPVNQEEVTHLRTMIDEMHAQFIAVVKKGRGDRLKDHEELFSGLVWTGEKSIELGLVDALGTSSSVARDKIGAEDIVDFTARAGLIDRIAERFGASIGRGIGSVVGSVNPSTRFDIR
ncbi:MAG: signal peptide peptidase SppA [Gammaproteobacteria bacterium]|nr:signal peptide peptidase SppA [Gammaproteobacteria bacterium]